MRDQNVPSTETSRKKSVFGRVGWVEVVSFVVVACVVYALGVVWLVHELQRRSYGGEYDGCVQRTRTTAMQNEIKNAMRHAWQAYRAYAWGHDILKPVSRAPGEPLFELAATVVDAIDTLVVMDLEIEYQNARTLIADDLNVNPDRFVNTFETIIRCLGGLLGAFTLTKDAVFLSQATKLGYALLPAFESSLTGIPFRYVNLRTGAVQDDDVPLSEATTVQLELRVLAHLSNESRFAKAADRAMCAVERLIPPTGLVESRLNATGGVLLPDKVTLGARGDSFYEYLLKQWLLTRRTDAGFWKLYDNAIRGLSKSGMLMRTHDGHALVAEVVEDLFYPKMDHLVCFLPGTLALGAYWQKQHELESLRKQCSEYHRTRNECARDDTDYSHIEYLVFGEELLQTCVLMYEKTITGLAPEIVWFNMSAPAGLTMEIRFDDAHNLQRPETVESLCLLCRLHADRCDYSRAKGREIFQAFQNFSRVETGGYSSLHTVQQLPPSLSDNQETFFLAETLKYLYLLFSSDEGFLSPTDSRFVLNTEGHFLPSFEPSTHYGAVRPYECIKASS